MDYSRAKPLGSGGRIAADRAFVLQLSDAPAALPEGSVSGRVENVATGEHAHFDSLQELEVFLRRSGGLGG